jgi:cytochrome c5
MADSHAKMTQATPQEIIISVLVGLFAPLLAIFLIVQLVLGIQDDYKPDTSSEAAQKATLSRIKPFAQLAALDANAPKVEKSGQEVYEAVCVSCHGSGALGAPKFENKGDWGGRLAQGYDTLVKHAIEGIRQMPARGGDGDLSDIEVSRSGLPGQFGRRQVQGAGTGCTGGGSCGCPDGCGCGCPCCGCNASSRRQKTINARWLQADIFR